MDIEIIEKYLIKKNNKKTDMVSSLKLIDAELIKEILEDYDVNTIEELAQYIIDDFQDILSSTKNDIFTQMFFQRLVNNENTPIFSAYEQDVKYFTVFVYEKGSQYRYYIPDELKEIIKKELNF